MGYQDNSFYAPSYLHTTPSIHDGQSSSPSSPTNKSWLSHSHFGDVVFSPDSAVSPYLSYIDEPWSPGSATTDDDASLASPISSLSPNSDLDTFPGEPVEDEDEDGFFSSLAVSPKSLYHPLEQYPLHASSLPSSAYLDDDDLSPLTFSPPSPVPLDLLSPSELGQQSAFKRSFTYSSPFQPPHRSFFDFDSSTPVPSSPSRRRSATLPELEPTFDTDLFGLHNSVPEAPPLRHADMNVPEIRWCSFPGCETDDDLIPAELASKKYIPDPSIIVPTISTGKSSLLLWDNDIDDRSDILTRRSPSPENFYLDPTILAECGDEELRKVYELRQRTSKNEKWERERCRELSALLRLKLDERATLGGGEGGDCSNHQSGLSCDPNLPFSSSPSSDSLTVYQPQPRIPSSFSSSSSLISSKRDPIVVPISSSSSPTLQFTSGKSQSEGPKHKIRSMSQLVASMLFHRQCDALRRHPSRKPGVESTSCSSHCAPSLSMGGSGMKFPSTPRSRLSKVILPEELEVESSEEEAQGLDVEEMVGNEVEEDHMEVDDGSLGRSCLDMDLDKGGSFGNSRRLLELEGKGWRRLSVHFIFQTFKR